MGVFRALCEEGPTTPGRARKLALLKCMSPNEWNTCNEACVGGGEIAANREANVSLLFYKTIFFSWTRLTIWLLPVKDTILSPSFP